jgi:hypothetical protein
MKCPSCNEHVGLFDPSLRRRKCPHCGVAVRKNVRHKGAFLLVLGILFVLGIVALALPVLWGQLLIEASSAVMAIVGLLALMNFELRTH